MSARSCQEGHGFSRAVKDAAMPGFRSRWGTVFPSSKPSYALIKRRPQGLKSLCENWFLSQVLYRNRHEIPGLFSP